jgi:short-subunit dehydrogenase
MAVKTWFITGTSRGFGREWAIAALDRGDMVAATARDIASLDDLAPSTATRSCRSGWTSPTAAPISPP